MRAGAPGLLIQTGPCWYLKWPTWVLHFDVFLSIYSEWWTFKHRLSNCFVFNSSQWKIQPLILIIFPRLRIALYFHMFLNDPWLFTCSTSHYLFAPFLLFFHFLSFFLFLFLTVLLSTYENQWLWSKSRQHVVKESYVDVRMSWVVYLRKKEPTCTANVFAVKATTFCCSLLQDVLKMYF